MSTSQISNLESAPPRRWTFDEVWSAEFAPAVRARVAAISARRSDAFSDSTLTVCGEEIRQMSPSDLLILDGFSCPFVCGAPASAIDFADVAFFLWQLHQDNRPGWLTAFRRGRMLGRLRRLDLAACIAEISDYCERMFADFTPAAAGDLEQPAAALQPLPTVHFLAPLLVSVAREIGHIDPLSGALISESPLPRLVQYQKAAAPNPDEKDDLAGLRSQCLARLNELNSARQS